VSPCLILTGGRGFVGRHLAPRIERTFPDHRLVMIVQSASEAGPPGRWDYIEKELSDEAALTGLIGEYDPEVFVHLAAQSSVGQALSGAESTWGTNVIGLFHLARAIAEHGPSARLFFFTSTADVYGASCLAGPASEETPPAPVNSYSLSKLAGERMLADLLPQRTRLIVTRAFNHSGAGHDERFVLPSFAAQIARAERAEGEAKISVGNLAAERDFLHVEDVVDAYERLLATADSLHERSLFNVASGEPRSLRSLLDMMLARAKRPIEVVNDPARMRPSDLPRMAGDASKLRRATGWVPRLGVEEIIEDLLGSSREKVSGAAAAVGLQISAPPI
jgi:GDP-4-dehydro-6-deoxy-D-mannose reductase